MASRCWPRTRIGSSSDPTGSRLTSPQTLVTCLSRFEERGFNRVIEVWGADHHGYVPRMKSAVAALGYDPEKLVIILHQMVNLKEGKMSKRAGRFVTLDELVDGVGSDAVRYFYLLRSPDTTIEFDLELATTQGNENPVYYAQYAHARLVNVEAHRIGAVSASCPSEADVSLLVQAHGSSTSRASLRSGRRSCRTPRCCSSHTASLTTSRISRPRCTVLRRGQRDQRAPRGGRRCGV